MMKQKKRTIMTPKQFALEVEKRASKKRRMDHFRKSETYRKWG